MTVAGVNVWQLFFGGDYTLSRLLLQRGLAAVYVMAFVAAALQWRGLLGTSGLLPVPRFLERASFWQTSSLFHWFYSDQLAVGLAWLGAGLAALALFGITERYGLWVSVGAWAVLYVLYLSFVNVGQRWYAFGWESLLLEAGFLAIFLGSRDVAPSVIVIWLFRWLLFRVMFGAGMIKLRGDECWRDLTCLVYHHETQPMPNPLSWYAHHLPPSVHKLGVVFNHFSELVVPFAYFLMQPVAAIAGLITLVFQGVLIATGNFSWLNWLTLVLAFSLFNTEVMQRFLSVGRLAAHPPPDLFTYGLWLMAVIVGILSVKPAVNLVARDQLMNFSFNPFHIAGAYGAFGSITKERYEIIVEGTANDPSEPAAAWREYEFRGKPGAVNKRPPQIAPYHLRLGWLMWFAAFSPRVQDVWFVRLVDKLLAGEPAVTKLLQTNPFPEAPPRAIRAQYYRYRFSSPEQRRETGQWWQRELVGEYLPAVTREHGVLRSLRQRFE